MVHRDGQATCVRRFKHFTGRSSLVSFAHPCAHNTELPWVHYPESACFIWRRVPTHISRHLARQSGRSSLLFNDCVRTECSTTAAACTGTAAPCTALHRPAPHPPLPSHHTAPNCTAPHRTTSQSHGTVLHHPSLTPHLHRTTLHRTALNRTPTHPPALHRTTSPLCTPMHPRAPACTNTTPVHRTAPHHHNTPPNRTTPVPPPSLPYRPCPSHSDPLSLSRPALHHPTPLRSAPHRTAPHQHCTSVSPVRRCGSRCSSSSHRRVGRQLLEVAAAWHYEICFIPRRCDLVCRRAMHSSSIFRAWPSNSATIRCSA